MSCNIRERYEEVLSVDRGEENLLPVTDLSVPGQLGEPVREVEEGEVVAMEGEEREVAAREETKY